MGPCKPHSTGVVHPGQLQLGVCVPGAGSTRHMQVNTLTSWKEDQVDDRQAAIVWCPGCAMVTKTLWWFPYWPPSVCSWLEPLGWHSALERDRRCLGTAPGAGLAREGTTDTQQVSGHSCVIHLFNRFGKKPQTSETAFQCILKGFAS